MKKKTQFNYSAAMQSNYWTTIKIQIWKFRIWEAVWQNVAGSIPVADHQTLVLIKRGILIIARKKNGVTRIAG